MLCFAPFYKTKRFTASKNRITLIRLESSRFTQEYYFISFYAKPFTLFCFPSNGIEPPTLHPRNAYQGEHISRSFVSERKTLSVYSLYCQSLGDTYQINQPVHTNPIIVAPKATPIKLIFSLPPVPISLPSPHANGGSSIVLKK